MDKYIIYAILLMLILFIIIPDLSSIDYNNLISIMGIFITTLAFMVGAYFALLATNAYSYVRDIEQTNLSITNMAKDLSILIDQQKSSYYELTKTIDDSLSFEINSMNASKELLMTDNRSKLKNLLSKRIKELYHKRSIFALRCRYYEKERRVNLIRELVEFGSRDDIKELENAIKNDENPKEIKKISKMVIDELKQSS